MAVAVAAKKAYDEGKRPSRVRARFGSPGSGGGGGGGGGCGVGGGEMRSVDQYMGEHEAADVAAAVSGDEDMGLGEDMLLDEAMGLAAGEVQAGSCWVYLVYPAHLLSGLQSR
jgi:hypothetical protein